MWTPAHALVLLALGSSLLFATQHHPLPNVTVLKCSSTSVAFAIQKSTDDFDPSISIDTACKLLDGSITTGCERSIPAAQDNQSVTVHLTSNQLQKVECDLSTVILLLQNVSTGHCMNWIWIPNLRLSTADRYPVLNETTIECALHRPTPGPTASDLHEHHPLPNVTVLKCSSTSVAFAIQKSTDDFNPSISIDTACKLLDGSITTGCERSIPAAQDNRSVTVNLTPIQLQKVECDLSTVILLLQNVSTGHCMNWIWIPNLRLSTADRYPVLNETTIECALHRPTPGPTASDLLGTAAEAVPPSILPIPTPGPSASISEVSSSPTATATALDQNGQDYILLSVALPVLFILVISISVIAVVVMVTVKVKCKHKASITIQTFILQDKNFQDSKFFCDIEPDEPTVYDDDFESDYVEGISICSLNSHTVRVTAFMGMEGLVQCQQQASGHVEWNPPVDGNSVQTEQVLAGGNYTTLPLMGLVHSPQQPTTDSGVVSCSQFEDGHSEEVAIGVKVSAGEQEGAINEPTEHEIGAPEFHACNHVHKPVLAGYVTLDNAPWNTT